MFVQSVTPIFDSFNTFLQAEEILIIDSYTVLYHSTLRLYRSLLSAFISKDFKILLEQWPSSIQGTVISLEPLNIKNY